MNKQKIIDYYNYSEIDYKLVWSLNESLALHYGYWDKTTKSLSQALQRENEILATKAKIKAKDYVLDAGCGVGGSCIYLAKNIGCKVVGITLSRKQVQSAKENVLKYGVSDLVDFKVMDYTKTKFRDQTFDVVWAIESVCHAESKRAFVKEAFRILKKGGRLIVADFFKTSSKQDFSLDKMAKGWAVESFESTDSFKKYLQEVGFKKITFEDVTGHIVKSAKRLYLASFPGLVIGKLLELVRLRTSLQNQNILAVNLQYKALKKNLWQYGIFYAEK